MQALTSSQNDDSFNNIKLVATDMDGTLTKHGQFTSDLLIALETLQQKNIDVLIVTGRSAGWVQTVANYLPISGAIAENGGLFYSNQANIGQLITQIQDLRIHRQKLFSIFELLQKKFPQIQESADNRFRLTDWTFDIGDLTRAELSEITNICQQAGWGFTYSTVQCHIKPANQDKALGLQSVVQDYFPKLTLAEIITVGDSPNDESLFNQDRFPLSIGVANILDYCDRLDYQPKYVTSKAEVAGFCELVDIFSAGLNKFSS